MPGKLEAKQYITKRNRFNPTNIKRPIKTLFIFESPPAQNQAGKFYYFYFTEKDKKENSAIEANTQEPLFSTMMYILRRYEMIKCYPETKEAGLREFQRLGYFLIDATYNTEASRWHSEAKQAGAQVNKLRKRAKILDASKNYKEAQQNREEAKEKYKEAKKYEHNAASIISDDLRRLKNEIRKYSKSKNTKIVLIICRLYNLIAADLIEYCKKRNLKLANAGDQIPFPCTRNPRDKKNFVKKIKKYL